MVRRGFVLLLGVLISTWPAWGQPLRPTGTATRPAGEPTDRATAASSEEFRTFDYRQAELRYQDRHWQIVADGAAIKDFGQHETEAKEALRIIRALRLNQQAFIGSPHPVLEYWLADGQAPSGQAPGLRLLPLDLNTLQVEEVRGQWQLRDSRRVYFTFGSQREEAFYTLDVIRHYGFKQVGFVGQLPPLMIYFIGDGKTYDRPPPTPPRRPNADVANLQAPKEKNPPAEGIVQTSYLTGKMTATGLTLPMEIKQLSVRREQSDWKLFHGGRVVANFGANQNMANEALGVLQHYRCTEMCVIGHPPSFTYFLVNGQPPRGLQGGLYGQSFNPFGVTVRPLGKNWLVCDGDRPLVSFGERQHDAQQLVQAIKKYQFDTLCRIGHGEQRSLTLLVKSR